MMAPPGMVVWLSSSENECCCSVLVFVLEKRQYLNEAVHRQQDEAVGRALLSLSAVLVVHAYLVRFAARLV